LQPDCFSASPIEVPLTCMDGRILMASTNIPVHISKVYQQASWQDILRAYRLILVYRTGEEHAKPKQLVILQNIHPTQIHRMVPEKSPVIGNYFISIK